MDAISSSVLLLVPIESSGKKKLGRKKSRLWKICLWEMSSFLKFTFIDSFLFFFHLQAVEVPSCLVYLESQIHVVLKRGLDVGKKLLKMTTIHRQLLGKFFSLFSKGSSHLLVNNLGHVSYFFMERVMLNTMYVKRNMYREHFVK